MWELNYFLCTLKNLMQLMDKPYWLTLACHSFPSLTEYWSLFVCQSVELNANAGHDIVTLVHSSPNADHGCFLQSSHQEMKPRTAWNEVRRLRCHWKMKVHERVLLWERENNNTHDSMHSFIYFKLRSHFYLLTILKKNIRFSYLLFYYLHF